MTTIRVQVTGEAGGAWSVVCEGTAWQLSESKSSPADTTVTMNQDDAWKVLMKRLGATDARARFKSIRVEGDQKMGNAILETVCVMA